MRSITTGCVTITRACVTIARACFTIARACVTIARACVTITRACVTITRACVTITRAVLNLHLLRVSTLAIGVFRQVLLVLRCLLFLRRWAILLVLVLDPSKSSKLK